ncbi:hypothetical protein C8A05DRAFT_47749 [Staphylotrichum tortipilum]|uniref:Rho-GAP domain-containing protein n=1 Tax=Staphylotrichum tortipilum TaxID=2831512 RepID=A0AAN6MD20_9PEZI|nr:hypothetical protein C8A05DRAFT_47749 [Staphylotrichum longicolle]
MTSAVPPSTPHHQQPSSQQQQQHHRANAPNPPSTPVTAHIQAAVSPPNKRDLKSWWKGFKLPLKHQESHEPRAQGIFGVPLRQSITYANVAISLVDEDGKSYIYGYVPIVVAKCGVFLKERATEIEGIFRLSGSEKRIKELKNIFDSPDRYGKGLVWDGYTVHDAANVLRRYLNDLPEPVVPLDLYEKFREPLRGAAKPGAADADGPQFVETFDMDSAIISYQQLITELPPLNRQLLLYILDLLAVFAAKSDQNRMTSQNLAAIFQPGMLSHPNHAMAPEEYRLNQCVIIFLIENQDHFLIGMQGTAADAKTVAEVQKGTPVVKPPSTPAPTTGITRSASIASAGAESVAKDGSIRRNKSTSSRRSFQSNGCPSPASPALPVSVSTPGLSRSNTLPSKKSPALQAGRFASRNDTHMAPLTPVTPTATATAAASPPVVVEQVATPVEVPASPTPQSRSPSGLQPGLAIPGMMSQERLAEPQMPEATTPTKERKLPILFQRMGSSESDGRQPNKLRKKRLPGSANPSAHSSTASLSHSTAALPNMDALNSLQEVPPVPASQAVPSTPDASHAVPSTAAPVESEPSDAHLNALHGTNANGNSSHTEAADPNTTHPNALHPSTAHASTLHPSSARADHSHPSTTTQPPLKPKTSPPTSLHSSFNEGSDLDQVEDLPPAPAEPPMPDTPSEKEKKKRWRLSRKKDDAPPPPLFPPLASPRPFASNATASASGTSINSSGKLGPSLTDMSDRGTIGTMDGPPPLTEVSSKESGGKEESKKIANWIKNKYREHKENVEQRRNKSPPPAGERAVSLGSSLLSGRGKSLDLKRVEEGAPPVPQPAPVQQHQVPPPPLPLQQVQNVQAAPPPQEAKAQDGNVHAL